MIGCNWSNLKTPGKIVQTLYLLNKFSAEYNYIDESELDEIRSRRPSRHEYMSLIKDTMEMPDEMGGDTVIKEDGSAMHVEQKVIVTTTPSCICVQKDMRFPGTDAQGYELPHGQVDYICKREDPDGNEIQIAGTGETNPNTNPWISAGWVFSHVTKQFTFLNC